MEWIRGFFNELDSSQLNYIKAGEFLPDIYKIKYTKSVNEFIQYCINFRLKLSVEQSYAAIDHLHNSVVWFNYISTDYAYHISFEFLCNYKENLDPYDEVNPGWLVTEYFFAINGENEFKTASLDAFKRELERWINL